MLNGTAARPIVGALISLCLIQACLSRASQIEGYVAPPSAANQNTVIPLEISARIEGLASLAPVQGKDSAKAKGNNAISEIRFRDSGEIGPNQTLRIKARKIIEFFPGEFSIGFPIF